MRNKEIRAAIESEGLKYWEVAEHYGVTDGNFSRLLRKELPEDKKQKVLQSIEAAAKKGSRQND